MNIFLEIIKCLCYLFLGLILSVWLFASLSTYKATRENNILIKELCIKQGLNVDSVLNAKTENIDLIEKH